MTSTELLEHLDHLIQRVKSDSSDGAYAEGLEFLRAYSGRTSGFSQRMEAISGYAGMIRGGQGASILAGFRDYIHRGLHSGVSPERRAQIDVVSDFLAQANQLLDDRGVHPAAPAVLIGASLEEFLRTWLESQGLSIGSSTPGLDSYAKALRTGDLITKQDVKDITAWAGLRNAAAHGEWDQVKDQNRVRLMLEGVNLFMRKYAP